MSRSDMGEKDAQNGIRRRKLDVEIDDYLHKQLSETQLEEFEVRLLEDPDVFQRTLSQDLMSAGIKLEAGYITDKHAVESGWLSNPLSKLTSSAAVLGIVTSSYLMFQQWNYAIPQDLVLQTYRGVADTPLVEAQKETVIRIYPGPPSDDLYSLELLAEGKAILEVGAATQSDDGALILFVSELAAGDYLFRATNRNSDQTSEYRFSVR